MSNVFYRAVNQKLLEVDHGEGIYLYDSNTSNFYRLLKIVCLIFKHLYIYNDNFALILTYLL